MDYVCHTTVFTWARYAMWFTPFEEKCTIIGSVYISQAAAKVALAHMTQEQRGPGEEYIIL